MTSSIEKCSCFLRKNDIPLQKRNYKIGQNFPERFTKIKKLNQNSFLDNAPNWVVGCIIQNRVSVKSWTPSLLRYRAAGKLPEAIIIDDYSNFPSLTDALFISIVFLQREIYSQMHTGPNQTLKWR